MYRIFGTNNLATVEGVNPRSIHRRSSTAPNEDMYGGEGPLPNTARNLTGMYERASTADDVYGNLEGADTASFGQNPSRNRRSVVESGDDIYGNLPDVNAITGSRSGKPHISEGDRDIYGRRGDTIAGDNSMGRRGKQTERGSASGREDTDIYETMRGKTDVPAGSGRLSSPRDPSDQDIYGSLGGNANVPAGSGRLSRTSSPREADQDIYGSMGSGNVPAGSGRLSRGSSPRDLADQDIYGSMGGGNVPIGAGRLSRGTSPRNQSEPDMYGSFGAGDFPSTLTSIHNYLFGSTSPKQGTSKKSPDIYDSFGFGSGSVPEASGANRLSGRFRNSGSARGPSSPGGKIDDADDIYGAFGGGESLPEASGVNRSSVKSRNSEGGKGSTSPRGQTSNDDILGGLGDAAFGGNPMYRRSERGGRSVSYGDEDTDLYGNIIPKGTDSVSNPSRRPRSRSGNDDPDIYSGMGNDGIPGNMSSTERKTRGKEPEEPSRGGIFGLPKSKSARSNGSRYDNPDLFGDGKNDDVAGSNPRSSRRGYGGVGSAPTNADDGYDDIYGNMGRNEIPVPKPKVSSPRDSGGLGPKASPRGVGAMCLDFLTMKAVDLTEASLILIILTTPYLGADQGTMMEVAEILKTFMVVFQRDLYHRAVREIASAAVEIRMMCMAAFGRAVSLQADHRSPVAHGRINSDCLAQEITAMRILAMIEAHLPGIHLDGSLVVEVV